MKRGLGADSPLLLCSAVGAHSVTQAHRQPCGALGLHSIISFAQDDRLGGHGKDRAAILVATFRRSRAASVDYKLKANRSLKRCACRVQRNRPSLVANDAI